MPKRKTKTIPKDERMISDLKTSILAGETTFLSHDMWDVIEFLEKLFDEHKKMKTTIESSRPMCPTCKTAMVRMSYTGYYDSFDFWECECRDGDVPVEHRTKGAYA